MSKVFKNTILLYGLSVVVLVIALYSSRVLLATLGVNDFGLYNIVGGVVSLFASLKVLFAFAVQRFLNFAKGENDFEKEKVVFNVSILLHIIIAIAFVIIVEAFGLWFISNKLNIPDESYTDAIFIFHISVLTSALAILITPYSAAVIANEKMNVFAWVSIIDAILRLLIILLLPYIPYFPVRTYALLLVAIEIVNFILYFINCRKYPECRIERKFDRKLFKEIASFAGWDFIGNTAWALINEGVNMILNVFGGVALNAARGIAYQVRNSITQLVNNVTVASRPRIIKEAASINKEKTFNSIYLMARALFMITLMTEMPLLVYAKYVLGIWLVEIPAFTVSFVQLVLVWTLIRTMNIPIDLAFTAYGKVKLYQIFNSIALLLNLPLAYLYLKSGGSYEYALLPFIAVEIIDIIVNLIVAHKVVGFNIADYVKRVVLLNTINIISAIIIGGLFCYYMQPSGFIMLALYCLCLVAALAFPLGLSLSQEEKAYLQPFLKFFIKKKK